MYSGNTISTMIQLMCSGHEAVAVLYDDLDCDLCAAKHNDSENGFLNILEASSSYFKLPKQTTVKAFRNQSMYINSQLNVL